MTTYNVFKEYIWLVNTIYHAKAISLREINEKWVQTDMSGGIEYSRTTFYRHRCAIEDIFGLNIECDKANGSKYYIANAEVLAEDSVQNWILSTISVSNLMNESMSLHDRILLENIPSGGHILQQIIKTMKESRQLMMTYRRYKSPQSTSYAIAPYCVKLFAQRWYMLGQLSNGFLATFALDRIEQLEMMEQKFEMPDDFDAAEYFNNSFGIVVDDEKPVEHIVLRAYGYEPYYLRDLPLHHSQREIAATDEYTDFSLDLKITSDFISKLMSRGEWLIVLEPQHLADEIQEWFHAAAERYHKRKKV